MDSDVLFLNPLPLLECAEAALSGCRVCTSYLVSICLRVYAQSLRASVRVCGVRPESLKGLALRVRAVASSGKAPCCICRMWG